MARREENRAGRNSEAASLRRRQLADGHTLTVKLRVIAIAAVLAGASGCARPAAPGELAGLWSRSLAACAAGLGVTFRNDAVRARFDRETFVLLGDPSYQVKPYGSGVLVRIEYQLPSAPGGVNAALGRGIIEIERTPAGRLVPHQAWFVDRQTGTARAALAPGPVETALQLGLCPSRAELQKTFIP
jgi:hypothetical protein